MPYARAPGRSVTAATSGRARRDSPGTSIRHEAARDGRTPYGPATLGATAPLGAGAAINRHRYVHRPPIGRLPPIDAGATRSEEHTSELQSRFDLVCRLLLEKKK